MKRLIAKAYIFAIPIICWIIMEGFLPSNTYTYRPWEAMRFHTILGLGKTFHPNSKIKMESVGQLCHHTKHSIPKIETWITDIFGNRNDSFIDAPDVLIIGDSNVVGSSVNQDSTITNQLQSVLGNQIKVYNIAPGDFSNLDYYLKAKLIEKPKMIIYARGERYVPDPIKIFLEINSPKSKFITALQNSSFFSDFSIFLDKILRLNSIHWIKARLSSQNGDGIPGIYGSNMYFYDSAKESKASYVVKELNDVERTKNNIVSYKEYCDSLGAEFLYLPVPKKETVYYDYVPFKQQPNNYLFKLDSLLKGNNVQTINILKLYNDYRKSHKKLLYHLDDTHWNANGIHIVSKEIAEIININPQYLAQD